MRTSPSTRGPHRRVESAGRDDVRLVGARGHRPAPDRDDHSARPARTARWPRWTRSPQRTEHPLIGKRLEMPARCRDRSEIFVELSIVQIVGAGGAALRRLAARHHAGAPAGGRDPAAERNARAACRRTHGAARSRESRAVDRESRPGGLRLQRFARLARAAARNRRTRHAVSRSAPMSRPRRSVITRARSAAISRTWASSSTTCSTSR